MWKQQALGELVPSANRCSRAGGRGDEGEAACLAATVALLLSLLPPSKNDGHP